MREALQQALAAMRAVQPYTDSLICYASTISEYPPNAIDGQIAAAIRAAESALAAPAAEPIGEVVIGEDGDTKGWTLVRWRSDLPPVPVGTKLYASPALAAPAAEPVAWRLWPESGDAKHWHYIERLEGNETTGFTVQPLYAEPVARKPMTNDEIHELASVVGVPYLTATESAIARAVERAHGIES